MRYLIPRICCSIVALVATVLLFLPLFIVVFAKSIYKNSTDLLVMLKALMKEIWKD